MGASEIYWDEHFRWVDSRFFVTADKPGGIELSLEVEARPRIARKDLLKGARCSRRQVAAVPIKGRQTVTLFLPVDGGKANEFSVRCGQRRKANRVGPKILEFSGLR